MLIAWWDTESNGLRKQATKLHSLGIIFSDGRQMNCADQSGYTPIEDGLEAMLEADMIVAHNGQDHDCRLTKRLYPGWAKKVRAKSPHIVEQDTLLVSRLVYPTISKQGPNTHKVPPALRSRHSVEAWGYRLGVHKEDYSHRKAERIKNEHPDWTPEQVTTEVWAHWDPEMSDYMMQDVAVLKMIFLWLMSRKPSPAAVETEHKFAAIMRRQEEWGFTFDQAEALTLQAEVSESTRKLEAELIDSFGEFWMAGKEHTNKGSREVKLPDFPDVTERRFGKQGKELKPYVGPPKAGYSEGAKWTPVSYVQFQPSSPLHVERMFRQRYGWRPKNFTDKGAVKLDDEVLRQLDYPEAAKLADLYSLLKILGYVSTGRNAWLKTAKDEPPEWRQHGRVNTIGTYTFRCSHSNPNVAQVPTRDPTYGHRCRALFMERRLFKLCGFDGSGMQLRLMAHHMAKHDGGKYAEVFVNGVDPHIFMADAIGRDLMGGSPGGHDSGRAKGKTIDYALPFGGGELRLGSIVDPHASEGRKREIGKLVKERLKPTFGEGFEDMKNEIRDYVERKGYLIGLDGRKAYTSKAHTGLSTLLQMGEAIVMRNALIILDEELTAKGLTCGVDPDTGEVRLRDADYEFAANVHDEAQADVLEKHLAIYTSLAGWCVAEAGRRLNLRCPLTSDVKVGRTWQDTH